MTVILIGLFAGVVAGMLGVGGGALFVPALTFLVGLDLISAEATSLLAMIPVALVGAVNQHRYGNVMWREALLLGALAIPGAALGVWIIVRIPEHAARIGFALLLLWTASRLARTGWRERREERGEAAA